MDILLTCRYIDGLKSQLSGNNPVRRMSKDGEEWIGGHRHQSLHNKVFARTRGRVQQVLFVLQKEFEENPKGFAGGNFGQAHKILNGIFRKSLCQSFIPLNGLLKLSPWMRSSRRMIIHGSQATVNATMRMMTYCAARMNLPTRNRVWRTMPAW